MTETRALHVLLVAHQMLDGNRVQTGVARCVLEYARELRTVARVSVAGSGLDLVAAQAFGGVRFVACGTSHDEFVAECARLDRTEPVDVVVAFLDGSLALAFDIARSLRKNAPVVYWSHVQLDGPATTAGLAGHVDRLALIFVPTESERRNVVSRWSDAAARCFVVPVGIRPPPPAAEAAARKTDSIAFVGRRSFDKGYDLFVAALREIVDDGRSVTAVAVGRYGALSPAARATEAALIAAGVIDAYPYLETGAVWNVLRSSRLLVLPTRSDCTPIAILEAWCFSTPVVAHAIPNLVDMAGDPPAIELVRVDSSRLLAQAVRRVLDDAPYGEQLAERGRKRVREEFSAAAMMAATWKTMSELV